MKNEEENLEMSDTSTASRRDRLRRPPPPEPPQRGSGSAVSSPASSDPPPRGPPSAVSNPPPRSSVRGVGVVASRVAAMTSTGSSSPGVSRSPTRQLNADSTSTANARRLVSYRLSSLDRLAQRQKLFEQNGISSSLASEPSVTPASTSATTLPALQSKRDLFFKNDPPAAAAAAAASTTTTTAATATAAAAAAAPLPSQNSINSAATATTAPTIVAAAPTTAAGISTSTSNATTAVAGGIASLKESLLASKENHVTTAPTNGSTSITTSSSSSSVTGSKIEALKRELAEDNREREKAILREKGPAPVPPAAASKTREVDYVGFANLPNQVYRRAVKKGFEFTLMVVGESGLGKSTLINSMFLADIYSPEYPGPSQRIKKTVNVEQCQVLLKENGVNLTLTVVDTPGFGDAVDNSNCWQPIVDFIESKYEEYLNAESRVFRQAISDNRVHVCLYFVAPTGHGLKPLDVEFMKRLHDKVNIIPIIAKADTMTPDECAHFKKQVLNEIAQHKIRIYEFPDADDEETRKEQRGMRERVPFAVVGSNTVVEVDGRKLRGRRYPWGVVEVENMEHCDFIALRNMLIRTHMTDLKEVTSSVHYENFRCRKLAGVGVATNDGKSNRVSNKNPLAQMEEERREHETKLKKMEQEMEQVFEMKVKEKTQKLKDSEVDLQRRHEQMMCSLESQKNEMDEKRKAFESEKSAWESSAGITLEELRRRSLESNSKEQVDGKDKSDKGKKKKGLF